MVDWERWEEKNDASRDTSGLGGGVKTMGTGLWGLDHHFDRQAGMPGEAFMFSGKGIPSGLAITSQKPDGQALECGADPRGGDMPNASAILVVSEIASIMSDAFDGPMAATQAQELIG